jgi:hypothetical protein
VAPRRRSDAERVITGRVLRTVKTSYRGVLLSAKLVGAESLDKSPVKNRALSRETIAGLSRKHGIHRMTFVPENGTDQR